MKCSRRSSVNLTGTPSARAASGTSSSSGHGWLILTPKPPPTSGVTTSTWPRSRPSLAATQPRTPVEVWVDDHTVIRPVSGSHRATTPRPSIGWQADRSTVRSSSSVWGAAAMAAGASPFACSIRAPTLPGTSSWTSRSAARAAAMPTTGSQELVVDPDPADGVLGDVAVVGDHERDRLADVVDLVLRQRVLGAAVGERGVRDQQRQRLGHVVGEVGQVVEGPHQVDALDVEHVGHVDVDDPGVGVRRPEHRGVQHPLPDEHVVDVPAAAAEEPLVLGARDLGAEQLGRHPRSRAISAAREHGLDDVLVAGAAAQVAGDHLAGLVLGGVGVGARARR